jgi:hypothetical protein
MASLVKKSEQFEDLSIYLPVLPEERYVRFRIEEGCKIVIKNGIAWEEKFLGFFQPVNLLAEFPVNKLVKPSKICWGIQGRLDKASNSGANGEMSIHLLSNLNEYNYSSLSKNDRKQIKLGYNSVSIKQLSSPDILLEQGYAIHQSARDRTGQEGGAPESYDTYRDRVTKLFRQDRYLVTGAFSRELEMINGIQKLCGYMITYAVESSAYITTVYVHTDYLSQHVNRALLYETVMACKRSGKINEVSIGYEFKEKPGLGEFKRRMGFPVVKIPSYAWLNPLAKVVFKRISPYKYARFTGWDNETNPKRC